MVLYIHGIESKKNTWYIYVYIYAYIYIHMYIYIYIIRNMVLQMEKQVITSFLLKS